LRGAEQRDLGFSLATDVIGGYAAWTAAGLPTAPAGECPVVIAPGAAPAVASQA
jgi:hypothetical protein